MSPRALEVPWPCLRSSQCSTLHVKRFQAFTIRFNISRSRHPYSVTSPNIADPVSTFIDFIPSLFCFLDLSIHPISSIHFSTMIDPLWAPPDAFLNVRWYCSTSLRFPIPPVLEYISFQLGQCPSCRKWLFEGVAFARNWLGSMKVSHS
jgi:hypothetical protein